MKASRTINSKAIMHVLGYCLIPLILLSCAIVTNNNNSSILLEEGSIRQAIFKHRVLERYDKNSLNRLGSLTIFLEGDGRPWIEEKHIAKDPSGNFLLSLAFMESYKYPNLYIGRPCYHELNDPKCHYRYWTSHRYSEEVLDSITNVIKTEILSSDPSSLILIGHSGGGAIASLIACQFDRPTYLITISANLDTEAWTNYHNWSPLNGSLNPAIDSKLCPHLTQLHFHGAIDEQIPVKLNNNYYNYHHTKPIIIENATHSNWTKFWPEIQNILKQKLSEIWVHLEE